MTLPELPGTVDASVVDIRVDDTPLTTDQARQLTSTIRDAAEVLWVLIARAHAGKAWQALGYPSWERYVRDEFNMSRSRSYQLLDQARVIAAIEAAVPAGTQVHISEATARDLKDVITDAIPEIRDELEGMEPEEATARLDEILAETRDRARTPEPSTARGTDDDTVDLAQLMQEPPQPGGDDNDFEEYAPATAAEGTLVASSVTPALDPREPAAPAVDPVDVAAIRRNVNAAHDLYASLSALAGLPDDLSAVLAIIPDERHTVISEHLAAARANLDRFADLWADASSTNQ